VIRCLLWWCQERRASYLLSPSVRRSVEPRPIWLLRPHLAHPGTNSARPQGRWLLPASGWSGIYKLYQLYSLSRTILHPKVYWKYFPNGSMPSVPWRCWLVGRKGIWPLKTEWWVAGVVFCPEQGTDLHMAQLIPLPFTCLYYFSKIQISFTFLLPAHPGSHGKRAVKYVFVCGFPIGLEFFYWNFTAYCTFISTRYCKIVFNYLPC